MKRKPVSLADRTRTELIFVCAILSVARPVLAKCVSYGPPEMRVLPSDGVLPSNGRILVILYSPRDQDLSAMAPQLESHQGHVALKMHIDRDPDRAFVTLAPS